MKNLLFPLLAAGLLSFASCSNDNKDATAENGNAGDNYMNSATTGDTTTTTMPANASDPANQPGNAGTAKSMDDKSMGDPNGPTAPHATDEEFMKSAAHSDQNEIQQSKMALAKGVTGMVKDHANMMIADHSKSTADLMKIAAKKGVKLPTDMDAEHKALAPEMEKLSGKAFEDRYMAQMVTDHQKTANTMMAHEKMTQDADLKGFIGKTLPVVQKHLANSEKHAHMNM
jgi:putative membrane protein